MVGCRCSRNRCRLRGDAGRLPPSPCCQEGQVSGAYDSAGLRLVGNGVRRVSLLLLGVLVVCRVGDDLDRADDDKLDVARLRGRCRHVGQRVRSLVCAGRRRFRRGWRAGRHGCSCCRWRCLCWRSSARLSWASSEEGRIFASAIQCVAGDAKCPLGDLIPLPGDMGYRGPMARVLR
jgi:hypothetical protein